MEGKNTLTRILAIAGTVLVWFPILAPILISSLFLLKEGNFRMDYLMPAELFLSFLLGGGLLFWAALRAHSQIKLVAGGLGLAILMLFGGQAIAVATGLASGAVEPAGWSFIIVIASLIVYIGGILLVGVGGIFLVKDLFKKRPSAL